MQDNNNNGFSLKEIDFSQWDDTKEDNPLNYMKEEQINLYNRMYPISDNELVDRICYSVMNIIVLFKTDDEELYDLEKIKYDIEFKAENRLREVDIKKFMTLYELVLKLKDTTVDAINLDTFTLVEYGNKEYPTMTLLEDALYDISEIIDVLLRCEIEVINDDNTSEIYLGKDIVYKDKKKEYKKEVRVLNELSFTLREKLDTLNESKEEPFKRAFAARLKSIAKKRGIKGKELAKLLHVRPQTISEWFNAKTLPSHHKIYELATHLKVDIDYLYSDNMNELTLVEDAVLQHTGISPKNLAQIQEFKATKPNAFAELSKTLNIILNNYGKYNKYDLLTAIQRYISIESDDKYYLLTKSHLEERMTKFYKDFQSKTEVYEQVTDFIEVVENINKDSFETIYNLSVVQLENIKDILKRIKDKFEDEYCDSF